MQNIIRFLELKFGNQLEASVSNMKISVIIPTLNEEEAIGKVLKEISETDIYEVIVVDSSTDGTPKIAESLGAKVVSETRKGYGRALLSGVEKSKGDVVVYIDGDFTYDPKDIPRLVEPILSGKCDVVMGNRLNNKMHPGAMGLVNRVGNTLLSLIFILVYLRKVNDTQCGLRAIRKKALKCISYEDYGMPHVTEQLIKLIKKGARIGNVAVTYRPRIGTTKLCTWIDGFKILKVILAGTMTNKLRE
ncbi:glycosyltransferase family 2 protein [Candidatus Bathyarchaeota archaeon]|nr:glycosyltransferase family 2 protein [Candidatus Bathyarchaeota archaeon]